MRDNSHRWVMECAGPSAWIARACEQGPGRRRVLWHAHLWGAARSNAQASELGDLARVLKAGEENEVVLLRLRGSEGGKTREVILRIAPEQVSCFAGVRCFAGELGTDGPSIHKWNVSD